MAKSGKKKVPFVVDILAIGIVPVLVAATVLTWFATTRMNDNLTSQTYEKLEAVAQSLELYYDEYFGMNVKPPHEYIYIDRLKDLGYDQSVYIGDTRYITTLTDENGERIENVKANEDIVSTVFAGEKYKERHVDISGKKYFVVYLPVYNIDGEIAGMVFAGIPEDDVAYEIVYVRNSSIFLAAVSALICSIIVVFLGFKITRNMNRIVKVVSRVSSGDLSEEADADSSIKELSNIATSVKTLQDNLRVAIESVRLNVEKVDANMHQVASEVDTCNKAADAIVNAVEDLAKGSGETASSVEKTAVSMQDIGAGIVDIHELTDAATNASKGVAGESEAAEKELQGLEKASEDTMAISNQVAAGINESAIAIEKIKTAADVIAEIASETALLALNASIEAARAGEAGRGFAVVADEISKLAAQSDASTQQIQGVVSEIIEKSEANVELANKIKEAVAKEGAAFKKVSNSFKVVNEKVDESVEAIVEITKKAESVDKDKDAIMDDIASLAAISEENAASCAETNASVDGLKATIEGIQTKASDTVELSKELGEAVAFFKL